MLEILRPRLATCLTIFAALAGAVHAPARAACQADRVDVGNYSLWVDVAGHGQPTVVFESGNGADSSVWKGIEPQIRALGVTTVVYDRSGLGQSDLRTGPYRIDDDVHAVRGVLSSCGVRGPLILVAHSYGGLIAQQVAIEDRNVKGLVLVDSAVPSFFDDAEAARVREQYRPQYDELREKAPKEAKVLIPILEAFPETSKRVRQKPLPLALPVIDIISEHPPVGTPEEADAWRKAHQDFVAASPLREAVLAVGSGHQVMKDKPEFVLDAIRRMIARQSLAATTK